MTSWGYDDGTRSLPSIIPDQKLTRKTPFSDGYTSQELQQFGRSFGDVWQFKENQKAIPGQKFNFVSGNTWGNVGMVLALTHGTDFQSRKEGMVFYTLGSGDELSLFSDYQFDLSRLNARTSATANLAYRLTNDHKILFRSFYTHDGSDASRMFEGPNQDHGQVLRDYRLRFNEEGIYSGQLAGEHYVGVLGNSLIEWSVTRARSTNDEPDLRETLYEFNPSVGDFTLANVSQSGFREFMNLLGSVSRTLNRPEFRELAPFDFTDVIGGRSVKGYPDLQRATIRNYDVRWEWFPGPTDLISASFFYKREGSGQRSIVFGYFNFAVVDSVVEVTSDVTQDTEWTSDAAYFINDRAIFVREPATLTIQAGTVILGTGQLSALVVDRGAKIRAMGTRARPVVMTSANPPGERNRADWGGLILNGRAPINTGEQAGEGDTGLFGGQDPNDSSGELHHTRVEFAGIEFSPGIYNVTFVGDPDSSHGTSGGRGALLREGTAGLLRNIVVIGFRQAAVDVDDIATVDRINGTLGNLTFRNSLFYNNCTHPGANVPCTGTTGAAQFSNEGDQQVNQKEDLGTFTTADWITSEPTNRSTVDPMLRDPYSFFPPDFRPQLNSPVLNLNYVAVPPDDGFFTTDVDFIGCMGPTEDWTEGWTYFGAN